MSRPSYTIQQLIAKYVIKDPEGCWYWQGRTVKGYGVVTWQSHPWRVHRLFYWYFSNRALMRPSGISSNNQLVLHRCGHHNCVHPQHLYLGDIQDAIQLRQTLGHTAHGEKLGVLTIDQVQQILGRSGENMSQIARDFHVHPKTIRNIIYRKTWREVDDVQLNSE